MPNELTRADAIRLYNTGAAADGNAQTDPDASIGNFRSGTEIAPLTAVITNPIANITFDFIAGKNGAGVGTLNAPTADTLTWQAPGGTTGAAVTILNGETKIIEDGTDTTKYVRVSRTSATALTGTVTATLTINQSNAFGFDTVSNAERVAGDINYRMVGIKNVSSGNVDNIDIKSKLLGTQQVSDVGQLPGSGAGTIETSGTFADWPDKGFCWREETPGDTTNAELFYYKSRTDTVLTVDSGHRAVGSSIDGVPLGGVGTSADKIYPVTGLFLSKDAPASQSTGVFSNPANEDTKPTGIDELFYVYPGDVVANTLSIGTLAAGEIHAVCMARPVPALQEPEADVTYGFSLSFDAP